MFPDASNDKARIRNNASTASQNYQCNKSMYTLSVFTLMEIVIVRFLPVYVHSFPTSSAFTRIWVTSCIFA